MPLVLTTGSTVKCAHSGTIATTSAAKLKVGGKPVLTGSSLGAISTCSTPITPPPPGPVNKPCSAVSAVQAGKSAKLKAGTQPVLLASLSGTTDGIVAGSTPVPGLNAAPAQTKLRAS